MSGSTKREKLSTVKEVPAGGSQSRRRNDHPLSINTVVRSLFGYLSLKDLESCKSVSQMWKVEAESWIRKRAKIVLDPSVEYYYNGRMVHRTPREFLRTFSNFKGVLPFNEFYLKRGKYSLSEVANLFHNQKSFKKLEIGDISLIDSTRDKVNSFNIQPWIEKAKVTALAIGVHGIIPSDPSRLLVPTNYLNWVTDLKLENCDVVIEDIGKIICPVKLDMCNVKIVIDGIILSEYRLNNLIDFHQISSIRLRTSTATPSTTLILDLGEEFKVHEIVLSGKTKIVNWQTSTCSVDSFCVENNPLNEKTMMRVKKLEVMHTTVDLVALSGDIERLTLEAVVECSEPVRFPDLSFLKMKTGKLQTLRHFASCYNLVDMDISETLATEILDLNWIPKSVKRLKMSRYQRLAKGKICVETLILGICSIVDAKRILLQINTKKLVLAWSGEQFDNIIPLIMDLKSVIMYVGPFLWNYHKKNFQSYDLSNFVDKKCVFYVFQNQLGKAIEDSEFMDNILMKV